MRKPKPAYQDQIAAARKRAEQIERDEAVAMSSPEWTERQRLWVQRYKQHGDATRAIKEAGYDIAPEYRARYGSELKKKPHIARHLEEWREDLKTRNDLSADRIVTELTRLAFGGVSEFIRIGSDGAPYVDMTDCEPETLAALEEFSVETYMDGRGEDAREVKRVKVKTASKLKALELLGKLTTMRLFVDQMDVNVNVDVAARIAAGRERIREARKGAKVIEGKAIEVVTAAQPAALAPALAAPKADTPAKAARRKALRDAAR